MASTENTSVTAPNNTNSGAPNAAGAAANYPMASLHVGDLSPEVTEAVLYEKFSTIGPVLSIRICRDIVTRQSLGYGYVNYQDPEDAERALDTFNFEKIGSQNVRIMWSQRDPSLRRSGVGNVFIKNLDKSVDNKTLYDTFVTFGTILSCKISLDENGVSKGYGFVHFSTQQSANNAIENLNNKIILDKKIYVGPFMDRVERGNRGLGSNRFTNLFVKNLPEDIDSTEKLSELFVPHGTITSAVVVFEDGKSKGFGFVCFQSPDSAEAAVKAINGTELNGKVLYVGRAQKKAEREAELRRRSEAMRIERNNRSLGANLFVKNLDDTINDEALHSSFAPYGTITSSKVMCDARGRSKGFGFVSFSTPEEATRAVTEMNGKIIVSKPLFVSLAQRKEDRIAQRNAMARIGTVPPQSIGAWPNLYLNTPQQQGYILPIGGMPMQPFSQEHMDFGHFRGQRGQFNMGRLPGNQYNLARGPRIPQGNRSVGSLIHPRQMPQWHTRGQGPNLNRHSRGQSIRGDTRPPFSRPLMEYPVPVANPVVGDSLQEIGERLYSLISPQEPNYAGKITGMLLEMERPDILEVINSPDLLKSKVDEALKVLMDHATTPAAPL